jgi:DNA-binding protein H-NS
VPLEIATERFPQDAFDPLRNLGAVRYLPYDIVDDSDPVFTDTDRKRPATDPEKEAAGAPPIRPYEPVFFPQRRRHMVEYQAATTVTDLFFGSFRNSMSVYAADSFQWSFLMAKQTLTSMSVDALLKLRDDIGAALSQKAKGLKKELALLGEDIAHIGRVARYGKKKTSLLGRKVAPKYRDPATGDTWASRGAKPRWLVARLKEGKKLEDFLIAKPAKPAKKAAKKAKRKAAKKAKIAVN